MKLPNSFELMGYTVSVERPDLEEGDLCGKWKPDTNRILVSPNKNKDIEGVTFWHEWMHCALSTLGYEKLNGDEEFVDRMAQCLYQTQKTWRTK